MSMEQDYKHKKSKHYQIVTYIEKGEDKSNDDHKGSYRKSSKEYYDNNYNKPRKNYDNSNYSSSYNKNARYPRNQPPRDQSYAINKRKQKTEQKKYSKEELISKFQAEPLLIKEIDEAISQYPEYFSRDVIPPSSTEDFKHDRNNFVFENNNNIRKNSKEDKLFDLSADRPDPIRGNPFPIIYH